MDIERRIIEKINGKTNEIIELSQRLIQFKSINPPGNEEEISNFLADKLRGLGFNVKQVEYAKGRPNIIAVMKGTTSEKKLLCYAHLDVVPPGDLSKWIVDPFEGKIIDDKIYGRGSQDHKFPIAPFIYAWKILDELKVKLKGDLILTFVVDEETGGFYGFKRLVEDGYFDDTDAMLYGGIGTLNSDSIIIGCNGSRTYRITVNGKGAHTAFLEEGVNAIVNAAKLIIKLQHLADKVNVRKHPITGRARMSINLIEGGSKENVVPDQCIITIDRRVTPSEDYNEVTSEILEALKEAEQEISNLKFKLEVIDGMPPATSDPDSEIVKAIKYAAKKVAGKNLKTKGIPASSDYSWYVKRTNKPVAMYSMGNAPPLAHSPNEHALISDLIDTTKVYALTMIKFLGLE